MGVALSRNFFAIFLLFLRINVQSADASTLPNLNCYISKPQLLEQWMWGDHTTDAPKKFKKFEFKDINDGELLIWDHLKRKYKSLNYSQNDDVIEVSDFRRYTFNENFEINVETLEFKYTEIFRVLGSGAQFYVAEGKCEKVNDQVERNLGK